jgi:hypothetical protein
MFFHGFAPLEAVHEKTHKDTPQLSCHGP